MKKQLLMMAAMATAMSHSTSNLDYELDRAARRARIRKPKERMRPVSPTRMKGNIRNLPCECGSGIKYKKCCYLATGE